MLLNIFKFRFSLTFCYILSVLDRFRCVFHPFLLRSCTTNADSYKDKWDMERQNICCLSWYDMAIGEIHSMRSARQYRITDLRNQPTLCLPSRIVAASRAHLCHSNKSHRVFHRKCPFCSFSSQAPLNETLAETIAIVNYRLPFSNFFKKCTHLSIATCIFL